MELEVLEFNINDVPEINDNICLCLGFFDGLHLGHQELIKQALKVSKKVGVFTFDVSPSYLLGKHLRSEVLTSVADKAEILDKMGVKYLFVLDIDLETLQTDKDEFIYRVLMPLSPKKIFCGEDFKFGKNAEGDIDTLKRYFDVSVLKLKKIDNKKISSRHIKELISFGMVSEANKLLGRPYSLNGMIVEGRHIGTRIGYPTANIDLDFEYVLPKEGVYACYVNILGNKEKGLLSISKQPTFRAIDTPVLEIHIIDFDKNIYGRYVSVELLGLIRDIIRFDSPEALSAQIGLDIKEAKKFYIIKKNKEYLL